MNGVNFGLCGDVPWRKKYTSNSLPIIRCSCIEEDIDECVNEREFYVLSTV